MLRSLVGSEMCIRDSPLAPYAASKKGAEAFAYAYHHLYGIDISIVRYFTCLLYTSDAADDLLCVDLGGRRIIKKKKQTKPRPKKFRIKQSS